MSQSFGRVVDADPEDKERHQRVFRNSDRGHDEGLDRGREPRHAPEHEGQRHTEEAADGEADHREPERHIDVAEQDARLRVFDNAPEYFERVGEIDRPGIVGAEFPGGEQQNRDRDATRDHRVAPPIDRRGFRDFDRAFVQRHCTCALMR